ncbi:uncharacterized protein LOC123446545 [Hordeum vulgare subsp. vulgare]|uniref:Predicted protein n=1 Tax=Hordeum vulgare subsp. vulgare TaxID=112509 RepID=F2CRJ1_HORVV|nr:uncharacterized protein LOC123446545 [Hordeum vulgare subsp. vulgare]BAJ85462.1 predicted protein [Hordeum vulgare subsp. vulgare]
MESTVIVLSIVVGLFGIGSAVLGFIAEATKLEPNDIVVSGTECVYPANPAFALGLVAALLLLVAQITVSAAGRCCGCCKPRGGAGFSVSKRNIGVVFSVLSWVAAVIAELYFVQGAAWNAPVTREVDSGCYFVRDGAFRRAAILSIIATVLGIKSFFLLRAAAAATPAAAAPGYPVAAVAGPSSSSAGEPKPDGIAMGHPAPMYGQAPYAHYPPPPNAQGYGQYPPPAQGQGYGHFHPAAPPQPQGQGYAHAV